MKPVPKSASIKSTPSAPGFKEGLSFLFFILPSSNQFQRLSSLVLLQTYLVKALPCPYKERLPHNSLAYLITNGLYIQTKPTRCLWTLPVPLWLSADPPSSSHWHLLLLPLTLNPIDGHPLPRAQLDHDEPPSAPQQASEFSSSALFTTASTLARTRTTSMTSRPLQRWHHHPSFHSRRPPLLPILRCPPPAPVKSPRGDALPPALQPASGC